MRWVDGRRLQPRRCSHLGNDMPCCLLVCCSGGQQAVCQAVPGFCKAGHPDLRQVAATRLLNEWLPVMRPARRLAGRSSPLLCNRPIHHTPCNSLRPPGHELSWGAAPAAKAHLAVWGQPSDRAASGCTSILRLAGVPPCAIRDQKGSALPRRQVDREGSHVILS